MSKADERMQSMKEIIVEILEIDPEEMTDTTSFIDDHGADSLRAIEIMSRIEKRFGVRIPQNELQKMTNLANVYAVVKEHAGWTE
jgi:acyl carrier protein